MSYVYLIIGLLVLAVAIFDLIASTLSVKINGPLAPVVRKIVWRLGRRISFAGPLILLSMAAVWIGLLWIGWTLVFVGAAEAVVESTTSAPGTFWDRLYFAGYSVGTLGLGDFVPEGRIWQILTVLCTFSGLVLITLIVTYYTAVVGAVAQKQHLASLIGALGRSAEDIVVRAWDGARFQGLEVVLSQVASMVFLHARRHGAYPDIHYFQAPAADRAISVQVARLFDAVVLLQHALPEAHKPSPVSLHLASQSLHALVDALHPGFIDPASEAPPPPGIDETGAAGLSLEAGALAAAFEKEEVRRTRRLLRGFVEGDGFLWSDVESGRSRA